MMPMEAAAAILLLIGTFFTLVGSIGLVRLPDFYTRMHAPTKATTLGVSCILGAATLVVPGDSLSLALKAGFIVAVLFISAPVGVHMLALAARHRGIEPVAGTDLGKVPPAPSRRRGEDRPPQEH